MQHNKDIKKQKRVRNQTLLYLKNVLVRRSPPRWTLYKYSPHFGALTAPDKAATMGRGMSIRIGEDMSWESIVSNINELSPQPSPQDVRIMEQAWAWLREHGLPEFGSILKDTLPGVVLWSQGGAYQERFIGVYTTNLIRAIGSIYPDGNIEYRWIPPADWCPSWE